MDAPLTLTPFTVAVRARTAARAALLDAWYGPVRETNPSGRRIYKFGCVTHLTEHHAPMRAPPSHADGRERLRGILKEWRTNPVFLPLSSWDDEHGGHLRRALVKAGLGLLVEDEDDDDARERADAIVQRVCHTLTPAGLNAMPAFMDALALLPPARGTSTNRGTSAVTEPRTQAETAARMVRILYSGVTEWDAGGVPTAEIPMPRSALHARRGLLALLHHWHEPDLAWLAALDRAGGGGLERSVRAQRAALAANGEEARPWADHLVRIMSEAVRTWEPLSVSCPPGTMLS